MKTEPTFVNKEQFVAILREAGITETQMDAFHRAFEKRQPLEHEAFLKALGLDETTVKRIREHSR